MVDIKQKLSETSDEDEKKLPGEAVEDILATEKQEVLEAPEKIAEYGLAGDETAHQKARQEIEKMDLSDGLKMQAQSSANDLKALDDQKKVRNLLELVKSKGVIFAVNVARKMDDPFVLDALHDELVKNGYYKEFLK